MLWEERSHRDHLKFNCCWQCMCGGGSFEWGVVSLPMLYGELGGRFTYSNIECFAATLWCRILPDVPWLLQAKVGHCRAQSACCSHCSWRSGWELSAGLENGANEAWAPSRIQVWASHLCTEQIFVLWPQFALAPVSHSTSGNRERVCAWMKDLFAL